MSRDLLREYVKWLEYSKSPGTAKTYHYGAKKFLEVVEDPESVRPIDISRFLSEMEARGLSKRTLSHMAWAVKNLYIFLGREDLAKMVPKISYLVPPPTWLPEEKIWEIVEADGSYRGEAVIATAYELALRVGELCMLNRSWYNPETKSCKVVRLKKRGHFPEQVLPMRERAVEILNEYLERRLDGEEPLFVVRGGRGGTSWRRMRAETAQEIFNDAVKRAGLDPKRYVFQTLRHSRLTHYAIEMMEEGAADPVKIAKFSGHININNILIYIHLAREHLLIRRRM